MDKVKKQLAQSTAILDPYAAQVPPLVDLSKKLEVNSGLLLGAIMLVASLVFMILEGWAIMITILTVIYPALKSINAVQSKADSDDKVWLTYWMLYGLFNVLDTFLGWFFSFIPYWTWLRLGFFLFLILPQFNGAHYVYTNFLQKFLKEHADQVKNWTDRFQQASDDALAQAKAATTETLSDPTLLVKAMNTATKVQAAVDDFVEVEVEAKTEAEKKEE